MRSPTRNDPRPLIVLALVALASPALFPTASAFADTLSGEGNVVVESPWGLTCPVQIAVQLTITKQVFSYVEVPLGGGAAAQRWCGYAGAFALGVRTVAPPGCALLADDRWTIDGDTYVVTSSYACAGNTFDVEKRLTPAGDVIQYESLTTSKGEGEPWITRARGTLARIGA